MQLIYRRVPNQHTLTHPKLGTQPCRSMEWSLVHSVYRVVAFYLTAVELPPGALQFTFVPTLAYPRVERNVKDQDEMQIKLIFLAILPVALAAPIDAIGRW